MIPGSASHFGHLDELDNNRPLRSTCVQYAYRGEKEATLSLRAAINLKRTKTSLFRVVDDVLRSVCRFLSSRSLFSVVNDRWAETFMENCETSPTAVFLQHRSIHCCYPVGFLLRNSPTRGGRLFEGRVYLLHFLYWMLHSSILRVGWLFNKPMSLLHCWRRLYAILRTFSVTIVALCMCTSLTTDGRPSCSFALLRIYFLLFVVQSVVGRRTSAAALNDDDGDSVRRKNCSPTFFPFVYLSILRAVL